MKKKLILLMLTGFIVIAGLSSCGEAPQPTYEIVRFGFPLAGIGTLPNGIVGVAIANGYVEYYLNAAGYTLGVQPFLGAAPAINAALAEKSLDVVEYFGFPGVRSRADGLDHKLITVTRWGSQWALAVSADSGIENIYDLAGKTIAYMDGTSTHMYLLSILGEAGLTQDDIVAVDDIPVIEGLTGVATGRFDATVIIDGQEAPFAEGGAVHLAHRGMVADPDVFFEPMVLIIRTEFYDEHPEVAVAFQKALLRTRESGTQDIVEFYRTMSEINGIDLDILLEQVMPLHVRYPLSLDEQYINRLQHTLEFLQTYGFTDGDFDIEDWHGGGRAIRLAGEYFYSN